MPVARGALLLDDAATVGRTPERQEMQSLSEVGLSPNPHVRQLGWHAHPEIRRNRLLKHMLGPREGEGGGNGGRGTRSESRGMPSSRLAGRAFVLKVSACPSRSVGDAEPAYHARSAMLLSHQPQHRPPGGMGTGGGARGGGAGEGGGGGFSGLS